MPARDVLKPRVPQQLGAPAEDIKARRKPQQESADVATPDATPRVLGMLQEMRENLPGADGRPADPAATPPESTSARARRGAEPGGPEAEPGAVPAEAPGTDRATLDRVASAISSFLARPDRAARPAGRTEDVFEGSQRGGAPAKASTVQALEGMLFDPKVFGNSRGDRAKAMTPPLRQAILEKSLKLLPKLLRYSPKDFNNYRPGRGDHVDYAPTTVVSYLRNTALTLMQGANPEEQKRLMPLLKEIFSRLQEFESQVKPPKAAARPGRELNTRLGSQMPDHPMVLPVEV